MKLKRSSEDGNGVDNCFGSSSLALVGGGLKMFPVVDSAQAAIDDILACYATLSTLPSLEPSPKVNEVFSRLVSTCLRQFDPSVEDKILSSPKIKAVRPHLLTLCSLGESCLESFWARKAAVATKNQNGNSPYLTSAALEMLFTFPYHSNYVDLTALELRAISAAIDLSQIGRIAFIGSGPLPLSSICLLQQLPAQSSNRYLNSNPSNRNGTDNYAPELSILNIDRCSSAIDLSRNLASQIGGSIAKNMHFLHATAETSISTSPPVSSLPGVSTFAEGKTGSAQNLGLGDCDVVFLAALVGENVQAKRDMLEGFAARMRNGSVVVVRTAVGLKGLLYPIIEASDLPANLEIVTIVHPGEEEGVVNSVIVARVRS